MSEHRHLIVGYVEEADLGGLPHRGRVYLYGEPNPSRRPVVLWERVRPCIEALVAIEREINPDRMRTTGHEPDPSRIWDEARSALANLYDTPGDG